MIDLLHLQQALDPSKKENRQLALGFEHRRLRAVIDDAFEMRCGSGDIAGIVRDALRQWQVYTGGRNLPIPLRVPTVPGWPTRSEWEAVGIQTVRRSEDEISLLTIAPWQPDWLPGGRPSIDDAVVSRLEVRHDEPCHADPIWEMETRLDSYKSPEQREAVRATLVAAADATLLVCLPTGAGKSLVGLLHALGPSGSHRLTVVVVPTTSLALDQERALREHLRRVKAPLDQAGQFAFHSGLTTEQRAMMLSAIRDGTQRVLFASPESVAGSLNTALQDAAAQGRLGRLVIDEAHIVAGWGAEFRPDFQLLAGVRRQLLASSRQAGAPFQTLLMTATATAEDVETLRTLFTEGSTPLIACGAVSLRPELSYWTVECESADERQRRLIDAILNLPRPIFVYTSTRAAVADIVHALRESGITRLVSVTGDSTHEERKSAVDALRGIGEGAPTADIAVGTSAFGLGIDVPGVRCVLHACLPETVDRYYQEVGRAGRDGRAALGLLLWTREDEATAASLNAARLITLPLARQRWQAMIRDAPIVEGVVWLPLDALRIGLFESSNENHQWNSRTLAAMARAGMVRLVGSVREEERVRIGVDLLRHDLNAEHAWDDMEVVRSRTLNSRRRQLRRVRAIASSGAVCQALAETYTVEATDAVTPSLVVDEACGGCAGCGGSATDWADYAPLPLPPPTVRTITESPRLTKFMGHRRLVPILDPADNGWQRRYALALGALCRLGVRHVVCRDEILRARPIRRTIVELVAELGVRAPMTTDPREFSDPGFRLADLPMLILIDPDEPPDVHQLIATHRGLPVRRLLVAPDGLRSWERRDMTLRDMHSAALTIPRLMEEIASARAR